MIDLFTDHLGEWFSQSDTSKKDPLFSEKIEGCMTHFTGQSSNPACWRDKARATNQPSPSGDSRLATERYSATTPSPSRPDRATDSIWDEWELDAEIDVIECDVPRVTRKRKHFLNGLSCEQTVSPSSSPVSSFSSSPSPRSSPSADWILDFDDVLMIPDSSSPAEGASSTNMLFGTGLSFHPDGKPSFSSAPISSQDDPKAGQNGCTTTIASEEEKTVEGKGQRSTAASRPTGSMCSLHYLSQPAHHQPRQKTRAKPISARKRKRCNTSSINKKNKQSRSKTKINEAEELLFTISHLLPRDKLPGVVDIIPPSYCSTTDDGLIFDINSLDKSTLSKLQEYVDNCLYVKPRTKVSAPTTPRCPGPRMKGGIGKKGVHLIHRLCGEGALDMNHIFQTEEILTIQSITEDEEVDVGDCFDS